MASIEEVRAALRAKEEKKNNKGKGQFDRAICPIWNAKEEVEVPIRFLPDGNSENLFFWVERKMIKMPFQGVKGEHDRQVFVEVPSMEMWGGTCPVTNAIRPYWDDPELRKIATTYYRKITYLMQGFAPGNVLGEAELPENPIRRFIINKQLFNPIKAGVLNTEYEELPTHFIAGRDFVVRKTTAGAFANYSSSSYRIKTRSLSEDEVKAIEQYGLSDLSTFLPKKPSDEEVEIIKEMFDASVTDQAFDMSTWGKSFRPKFSDGQAASKSFASSSTSSSASSLSSTTPAFKAPAFKDEEQDGDEATPVAPASSSAALARIKGLSGNSAPVSASALDTKSIISKLRSGS